MPESLTRPTRTTQKATYQAYQQVAKRLAEDHGDISIPDHPEVLMVEDGAFVEAHIWIPKEALGGAAE